jgi:hypothetical protein
MGFFRKVEDEIKDIGRKFDDAVIQPIVDNPAAVVGLGLNFFAPGLGTAIGGALGASGATAAVLGGAVIGGATAELTGGDFVKGAIGGGIGAGVGQLAKGAFGSGTVAGNAAEMGPMTGEQLGQSFENTMSAAGYQPLGSALGQGYYDEMTGQYIQDANGGLQAPLTPSSGTADMSNWTVDPTKGTWTDNRTGEIFSNLPGKTGSLDPWNPSAQAQTGAQIMQNAGALPGQTTASNDLMKQLLGVGATAKGVSSGLLGTGAPTGAGEDQVFGKANQSKYSFDVAQPQQTPQSLMTISQLLGRR